MKKLVTNQFHDQRVGGERKMKREEGRRKKKEEGAAGGHCSEAGVQTWSEASCLRLLLFRVFENRAREGVGRRVLEFRARRRSGEASSMVLTEFCGCGGRRLFVGKPQKLCLFFSFFFFKTKTGDGKRRSVCRKSFGFCSECQVRLVSSVGDVVAAFQARMKTGETGKGRRREGKQGTQLTRGSAVLNRFRWRCGGSTRVMKGAETIGEQRKCTSNIDPSI